MEMLKLVMFINIFLLPLTASGLGQWRWMDVSDPHVVHVADFAVSEHNEQSNTDLKLVHLIDGQFKVVAPDEFDYKLKISAKGGEEGHTEVYHALVTENPLKHADSMTLKSFTKVE